MEPKDITLSDADIIEYNRDVLPRFKGLEPAYSIIARARNHDIQGGDSIDIDIYLTGQGIPDANKLVLLWSSPDVVDALNPGTATYCIRELTKRLNGEKMIAPVAGPPYVDQHELDPNGLILYLSNGYFFPEPEYKDQDSPAITGERCHSGCHPISISLKTLNKAKSGDYEINFNLTYIHNNIVKQASDKVRFHITSWWDRNRAWVITAGTISAFILLGLTLKSVI